MSCLVLDHIKCEMGWEMWEDMKGFIMYNWT